MVSSYFTYQKPKVIQALRYHFISRMEIKTMLIAVNIFAIISAVLFFLHKISPLAFLIGSMLWFSLMIIFWFIMPTLVYKRERTFKDSFKAILSENHFTIENERGSRDWGWKEFSNWIESPHFFHLYFNSRSFFIIPKDAFEGGDVHEARKILAVKIRRL